MTNITLPSQLQAIDRASLTPLVREIFRSDKIEVRDWQVEPIKFGIVNPVTFGIFRVRGTAQKNNIALPWSMVLKILHPAEIVPEYLRKTPDALFSMHREASVYRSNLKADFPDCIAMPRCFGVSEQPDKMQWLWMEEIVDAYPAGWLPERYAKTGRHLGIFNGRFLTGVALPDYPWLVRQFLRSGIPFLLDFFNVETRLLDPATWEHPMVHCAFPTPVTGRFMNLIANSDLLVDMVERLPQVLCHHDVNWGNVFARQDAYGNDQTILLDWAFTGISGVGCELAHLTWGTFPNKLSHNELIRLEPIFFENYLAGLREVGWEGDESLARFGYLAHVFFHPGIFRVHWLLSFALDEAAQRELAAEQRRPITEILAEEGAAIYCLLDRGEEALRLVDKVTALL